jgi:hypothetical protein
MSSVQPQQIPNNRVRALLLKDLGAVRRGEVEKGASTAVIDDVMATVRRSPEDTDPETYVPLLLEHNLRHFAGCIMNRTYHDMLKATQPK